MKISVLLPTRKRVQLLLSSIGSLLDTANDPDNIDVLLAVDDDDPSDYGAYVDRERFHVVRGKRWGYFNIYHYYNALAALSDAQILLVWNDDMQMLTGGWDKKLLEYESALCVQFLKLDTYLGTKHMDTAYPAVSRKLFEVLGHLALNCHIDTWLARAADRFEGSVFRQDIVVRHDHGKILDEVWNEKSGDLEGLESSASLIEQDGDVLNRYLKEHPEMRHRR